MKRSFRSFLWFLLIPAMVAGLPACRERTTRAMRIGLTKSTPNYENWLKKGDSTLIPVNLYPLGKDSALTVLRQCDGLLITGGEDVDPSLYGMAADTSRCGEIDRYRDTLEMALILEALALKIPILGICRGEQILNVTLGGSLVIDIPSDFGTSVIHRCDDYLHCNHPARVEPGSMLLGITGRDTGMVNTNHHQAVNATGRGLRISVRSSDGLPEGIEWIETAGKPFLVGVQWHPERMDTANPFSGRILRAFLETCRENPLTKKHP
jgi:putative glutamine amidotransferase